ncbi:MAG: Glycogen synthase [Chloroflexi bacterium AL-N1]|nr:Glycogen synthase [Chloroflexi bacterium AL-N1]NOK77325.1 Glycogen synthase [Chloroflexi bacterium AL-N5]
MKICMLTSSYPKYRGETTAPFIEEIAAGLVRRGHTVHVVAPFHRDVRREAVERGVYLHFFRYSPNEALNIWGYAESLHADVTLRRNVLVTAPLALSASLLTVMQLINQAEQHTGQNNSGDTTPFDIVHAHWVLPNGVPAAIAARLYHLPLVISLHGSDVFLAERNAPLSLTATSALRAAGGITACSSDLRERALRLGARIHNFDVVPYGVDPTVFRPDPSSAAFVRTELGLEPDTPLIVTIGRLVYKKGLTYLLEAFHNIHQHHPQAVLIIAGYGDLRETLEQRAHELGIASHVYFPGKLERERAARYISAADVYTIPSIRDQDGNVDGLPNVLLEGMGSGRPIVASRVAGIPEVIDDGVHGLLVPERDADALANAITQLLDNRILAHQLGVAARRRIEEELTWDATAARFERVYHHALQTT